MILFFQEKKNMENLGKTPKKDGKPIEKMVNPLETR